MQPSMQVSRLELLEQLASQALAARLILATAESCTGGGVAKALTEIAGSSAWFTAGLVTYSNTAKEKLLGVKAATLQAEGAVSAATVKEMVAGACLATGADVAVAVSGVAGPEGGSSTKPVGTVWLAWGNAQQQTAQVYNFVGNRRAIREASIDTALQGLLVWLQKEVPNSGLR